MDGQEKDRQCCVSNVFTSGWQKGISSLGGSDITLACEMSKTEAYTRPEKNATDMFPKKQVQEIPGANLRSRSLVWLCFILLQSAVPKVWSKGTPP